MPNFSYRALTAEGQTIDGTVSANSRPEAITRLKKQGVRPLNVDENSAPITISTKAKVKTPGKGRHSRVTKRDVQVFTAQLAALLKAGIILSQALAILEEQTESTTMEAIIRKLRDDIHGGTSLSDSLSQYPKYFSTLYSSMIRVGESGGVLDEVLRQLASFMEAENTLKNNVMTAMSYPMLVVMVGLGSIGVLVGFVIPRLSSVFADFGDQLPLLTRVLISGSAVLLTYWWLIALVLVGAIYGLWKVYQDENGREYLDSLKDSIPLVGTIIIKANIARFSRTMATLITSGIPVLTSINLMVDTSASLVLRKKLQEVSEKVKKGEGLATPLKETGFFPPMATNLIAVGEESGSLDEMLTQVAETYDQEVQHAIKRFITIFEPAVIILMALGVGGILFAFLLPIMNISNMVK